MKRLFSLLLVMLTATTIGYAQSDKAVFSPYFDSTVQTMGSKNKEKMSCGYEKQHEAVAILFNSDVATVLLGIINDGDTGDREQVVTQMDFDLTNASIKFFKSDGSDEINSITIANRKMAVLITQENDERTVILMDFENSKLYSLYYKDSYLNFLIGMADPDAQTTPPSGFYSAFNSLKEKLSAYHVDVINGSAVDYLLKQKK